MNEESWVEKALQILTAGRCGGGGGLVLKISFAFGIKGYVLFTYAFTHP